MKSAKNKSAFSGQEWKGLCSLINIRLNLPTLNFMTSPVKVTYQYFAGALLNSKRGEGEREGRGGGESQHCRGKMSCYVPLCSPWVKD